jgi:hypothetical protein
MINTLDKSYIQSIISNAQGSRSIQILDIHSKKARNLLRGVNPSDYNQTKVALEKIRLNCNLSDYKKALLHIRTNQIFENNEVGQLLNEHCPKGLTDIVYFSFSEITIQVENYASELSIITNCATDIFKFLKVNNLERALDACEQLAELKGTSVFLIRMLSFITNRYQLLNMDDKKVLDKVDKLKLRICLSTSPIIEEVVTQLSNLRTSHLAICKRINDSQGASPNGHIAKSFINPIPRDLKEFTSTLSAFFAFSLFDAFLYLQMISKIHLPFLTNITFSEELSSAYLKLSAIEFEPSEMYEGIGEDTGYYYLRECFLFTEQPKAFTFLSIHGHYYSDFTNQRQPTPFAKGLIDNYFLGLNSLNQLRCSDMTQVQVNWEHYDSSTCGMLENSSAFIHLLTKKQGQLNKEELLIFVKLMSFSRDIGEICHPEYLECISNSATDNQLRLVAKCLITTNRKNQFTEHQLRTTIQEYCIEEFDGDLIKLLQFLYGISPAVTEHLLMICNETFLSTLFHLMDRPVDALEVRASMLHWFGEKTGEELYLDRAKTLRIDIQINKEKGTIDDSRIYVDPLKFTQWFEDNMVSKLTMALDNVMRSNSLVMKLNWNNKNTGVGSSGDVTEHLLACYEEFCNNRIFGIASYLGRRIRHGTFKGTAITELRELPEKEEYVHLFEEQDFKNKFDEWMNQYEAMIEDLVKTSLQIKSKRKPNGLITNEIDSSVKNNTADLLVCEILAIYSKKSGVIRLPSIIIDFCWRLAENDLVKTKKFLSEKKSSYGVFSYSPKNVNSQLRRQFSKFSQEVNSLTGQKFGLMASWFNKPNYASPSTDIYLLFNAVISEVKGNVSHFAPDVDLGDRSFSVNGGTYYVIYDALYVLIHNAACHGKLNGKIHFFVSKPEERNAIRISLMTELESAAEVFQAQLQIEAALNVADDDAHIVEGKSGIKKLKKLENEGSISDIRFTPNEKDKMVCFEFYFELSSRGKYDDIDS